MKKNILLSKQNTVNCIGRNVLIYIMKQKNT